MKKFQALLCMAGFFAFSGILLADDGSNGRPGRDGFNGNDATVLSDGRRIDLNLSAGDGSRGGDGEDGRRPYCYRTGGEGNVYQPRGGAGGNGGRGGSGGDGGDLTVYYSDIQTLKNIFVNSRGGDGAQGGYGGRGARGCDCDRSTWEIRKCHKDRNGKTHCRMERYYCYNGSDGSDGHQGSDGSDGSLGKVVLIGRTESLPDVTPSLSLDFTQALQGPFDLSNHKWTYQDGGRALFGAGSAIADHYKFYKGMIEARYQFAWEESRPITDFKGERIGLSLDSREKAVPSFPSTMWIRGVETEENGIPTFVIQKAIKKTEAKDLVFSEIPGKGVELTAKVIDQQKLSDLVKTKFEIDYYVKRRMWWSGWIVKKFVKVLAAKVPDHQVSVKDHVYELEVGKLDGMDPEHLSPGGKELAIKIVLKISRTFDNQTLTLELTKEKVLKK